MTDREQLLKDEYDRIVLDETDGPELLDTEDRRRRRLREQFRSATGQLPSAEVEQQILDLAGPTYQTVLDEVSAHIEKRIPYVVDNERKLGTFIDDSVFVRAFEFPAGTFNAQIRPVEDVGYLILVDSAALELTRQATKLLGYVIQKTAGGLTYRTDAFLGRPPRTPAAELAELVAFYLGLPVSGRTGALPSLAGDARTRMDELYRATVGFVVAHEYAHALAGHFTRDYITVEGLVMPLERQGLHTGESSLEIAADWLAVKLLHAQYKPSRDDKARTMRQTLLAGPFFFLALQEVIAEAERRHGRRSKLGQIADIAPPKVREAMIDQLYKSVFGETRFPLMELYMKWPYSLWTELWESDALRPPDNPEASA